MGSLGLVLSCWLGFLLIFWFLFCDSILVVFSLFGFLCPILLFLLLLFLLVLLLGFLEFVSVRYLVSSVEFLPRSWSVSISPLHKLLWG